MANYLTSFQSNPKKI